MKYKNNDSPGRSIHNCIFKWIASPFKPGFWNSTMIVPSYMIHHPAACTANMFFDPLLLYLLFSSVSGQMKAHGARTEPCGSDLWRSQQCPQRYLPCVQCPWLMLHLPKRPILYRVTANWTSTGLCGLCDWVWKMGWSSINCSMIGMIPEWHEA